MSTANLDIAKSTSGSTDDVSSFLPNFCSGKMALTIVLIAELVAILLALAGAGNAEQFWTDLARISMLLLWLGLANAAVLCLARKRLQYLDAARATVVCLALVLLVCAVVSEATFQIGRTVFPQPDAYGFFPVHRGPFILRNLGICLIVAALTLRYFYVAHQWRINVQLEARSRVRALQARIRPHFLFNSLNTIAALTRSNPELAERAVEDLADLFRASLADSNQKVRLRDELEMVKIYQRIEELRLGERLRVLWSVDSLPMNALIPGISIQPLLENAIYHGIEQLPEGGEITIEGELKRKNLSIMIRNPVSAENTRRRGAGNQIALDNIRQRYALAYDGEATVKTSLIDNYYSVYLRFPLVIEE